MAEATPARMVGTLGLAGLLSGLILVGVFLGTKDRIEQNQAEALEAAIYRVLPGTASIVAFVAQDGRLERYSGAQRVPSGEAVFAGYGADGALAGWAIPADGPGFMDTIKLIYGYDPARRTVVGMEVLDSRETPGLGDKIIFDAVFLANFKALAVEPRIFPVKKGKKSQPNQVDCITGATISSEAVVSILNRSTVRWLPLLAAVDPAQGKGAGDGAAGGP